MADVDVVIVSYRSAHHIAACLASLHAGAARDGVTIAPVVVNNSSDAAELAAAVGEGGGAEIVQNAANFGFAAACNQGAARGTAPAVLFLNPDATLAPGALKALIAVLNDPTQAQVGIVGPALRDAAGALVRSCSPLPTGGDLLGRTLGLHVIRRGAAYPYMPLSAHDRSGPVGQVMGAALMIRRSLFAALGGFDERFFLYYEDVDLCARARAFGFSTWYVREAEGSHIGAGSSSQDSARALALHAASRLAYMRKHFGPAWGLILLVAIVALEFPARVLFSAVRGRAVVPVLAAWRLLFCHLTAGAPIGASA